jgi:mannose-6-phosphate isomerase class I
MHSTYDKFPYVAVAQDSSACHIGWESIAQQLLRGVTHGKTIVCVECYPGVFEDEIALALNQLLPAAQIVRTTAILKPPAQIETLVARDLTADRVFGHLTSLTLMDFFDALKLERLRQDLREKADGLFVIIGVGATLVCHDPEILVYADLARWEIQQRQRRNEVGNLGAENKDVSAAEKYKRAFFLDWRLADRFKSRLLPKIDYLLDTNDRHQPKMISGHTFRQALVSAVHRPFRVVPFFDPGPWGGQWMRKVCNLPAGPPNYAWCFDCVPEENSLLLGFGEVRLEVPALDLVLSHPRELLGDAVHGRFGAEFPIRFDFLDTMEGGNLSLQVHPLTEYIQETFGMHYTQDESYYILDAAPDAGVYLGLKEDLNREAMIHELHASQNAGVPFPVDQHVNLWAAKKHDHFLIPAGTIHCSGRNSMVLEISATPYIFTFKLWDWGRLGMDGRPRPIHLEHGLKNIDWTRTTGWVRRELINQAVPIAQGQDWREEHTGLHSREFIETRRHWFSGPVTHNTNGGVNVLNLVEGEEIVVSSPTHKFEPVSIHYAETFIVPAAVGEYIIQPVAPVTREFATIKAFVRTAAGSVQ